jgi:hypothetical protein
MGDTESNRAAIRAEMMGRRQSPNCECCGGAERFIVGIHCTTCGHDQGSPINATAFMAGAL